jgi:hypothetical protein
MQALQKRPDTIDRQTTPITEMKIRNIHKDRLVKL